MSLLPDILASFRVEFSLAGLPAALRARTAATKGNIDPRLAVHACSKLIRAQNAAHVAGVKFDDCGGAPSQLWGPKHLSTRLLLRGSPGNGSLEVGKLGELRRGAQYLAAKWHT